MYEWKVLLVVGVVFVVLIAVSVSITYKIMDREIRKIVILWAIKEKWIVETSYVIEELQKLCEGLRELQKKGKYYIKNQNVKCLIQKLEERLLPEKSISIDGIEDDADCEGCEYCRNETSIFAYEDAYSTRENIIDVFVKDIECEFCPKCGRRLQRSGGQE